VPVVHQPQGVHKFIEFGNRTLTGVVGLTALAVLIAAWYVVRRDDRPRRLVALALSAATAVVLLLGTVVTGSGPHSGDATAPARFGLDPRSMSWLHADAVLVWFGLLLALIVALRLTGTSPVARRAGLMTLVVGLLQGVIGYVQYFTGLPVVAVALHMLGACLLVIAVTRLVLSLRDRPVPLVG
jgi:cytochrome c oxidase assembly protein subunit 15